MQDIQLSVNSSKRWLQTYNNFFNLLLSEQLPLILQQELDVEQGNFSKVR